jgi:hypothetical protein
MKISRGITSPDSFTQECGCMYSSTEGMAISSDSMSKSAHCLDPPGVAAVNHVEYKVPHWSEVHVAKLVVNNELFIGRHTQTPRLAGNWVCHDSGLSGARWFLPQPNHTIIAKS